MDGINKFLIARETIFSDVQQTTEQPVQPDAPISNLGIANTSDSFESIQQIAPFTTPEISFQPPPQAETVDPSSIFNFENFPSEPDLSGLSDPMDLNSSSSKQNSAPLDPPSIAVP